MISLKEATEEGMRDAEGTETGLEGRKKEKSQQKKRELKTLERE